MLRIPFDPSKSADQSFQVLVPEKAVLSIRLVWPRWPLLKEHKASSPIEGDIIALPVSSSKQQELTEYDALGNSWGLFYLSPEDVAEWEAANGLG